MTTRYHILKWVDFSFQSAYGFHKKEDSIYSSLLVSPQPRTWTFSSVQPLSRVWLFATPWTAARQASLSFTISQSLLKLMPTESVIPTNYLVLCHPLLLLPSIFSNIRFFSNKLAFCIRWPSIGASASALPMNIQDWFPLQLTDLISLLSKGFSRVFSNTTVPKQQFFDTQLSLQSNSHIHAWLPEKPQLWLYGPLSAKWCLCFSIHCLGFS